VTVVLLWLIGCAADVETADTAPPVPAICVDAPVTTWDNFGSGFTTESCQACHSSTSAARNGAPEDVTFDTEADVALHVDLMLDRATGEAPTMPPQGGVTEDDRQLLEIWLRCFPPG
jgi:uncharacterized membrane protein